MTFIAGAYTLTCRRRLDGLLEGTIAAPVDTALGQLEDGVTFDFTKSVEPVRGDNVGDAVQDGVFRSGDCFMDFSLIEWNSALLSNIFWPEADNTPTAGQITDGEFINFGKLEPGNVGRLLTAMSVPILLTKVTGPNASPAFIFAAQAIIAPGYPVRAIFAPRLRRLPLRLQLLPYQRTAGITNPYFWFEGALLRASVPEIAND